MFLAFRRPGPVEYGAGGVVLALVAAIVIFLLLFDWNWLRGPIGRWASAEYDRQIELRGDLDVRLFSWTPSVTVRGLYFGGPDWARDRPTAEVARIDASIRLRKLLVGQIEMPRLAFDQADIVLLSDENGRQSWALHPDRPDTGEGLKLPVIQQLIIRDGDVVYSDRRRDLTLEATLNARETTGPDDRASGFLLDGRGSLNRSPLTLRVEGGPFINIRRNRPYGFKATLAGAGSRLVADGRITRPFDLGRFEADLSLEGRDLADLYLLTGVTLPNTPPYRLAGDLRRDRSTWTFDGFNGRVGASDLSGDVLVEAGERLNVEAELASQRLDLDDLMAILGARTQTSASGANTTTVSTGPAGKLLPNAPLQTERLRTMDGRLSYRAVEVKANDLDVRRVSLGAVLKDGVLNLDPVAFAFNRGELNGTARIDARKATPYSVVDFRLAGYPLESIVPARGETQPISGRALGRAQLEGPGASIAEFAGASKGRLSLVVPQGRMRAAFAELLGVNASAGLLKLFSGDQSETPIRCGVAEFAVAGGVATARTLVIDTDVVLAKGTGTINLGSETLDLTIDGESKKPRLLRLWTPIRVRGPLTAPGVGVDAGAVVSQVGLTGLLAAVVAPVAAVLGFVEPGLAEDADCGRLIAAAR